jgi:hypothetical protein
MIDATANEILEQLKRKLNVSCLNAYDAERLSNDIIPDAVALLAPDLGMTADEAAAFDWSQPSRERLLLVNYCFYEFNHAAEQFASDYAYEIAKCMDARLASQYVEAATNEE